MKIHEAAKLFERIGVEGYNKPKRTPNHPTKSHVVVAKEGNTTKTIRFGQQGVSGSPAKKGESEADKARRKSFKARHAKNIAKGKLSAAWWADKIKWRKKSLSILSSTKPSLAKKKMTTGISKEMPKPKRIFVGWLGVRLGLL